MPPIISSWIWYRVGSRDEPSGVTGASHWVEHMLFKGTPTFPSTVLDKAISRKAAWNAMTFIDWTTFFETMPADKIDLGLRQADRVVNSLFDPEEVEVGTHGDHLRAPGAAKTSRFFKLGEEAQAAAFVHPYHHEVIGDLADLQSMQREDLFRHFRAYYVPNNAVLAIAGRF